jgi:YD repeat-containing protein
MTDPQGGGTTYVYDVLNRLSTLTSPQGQLGLGYDALSRRTSLTRGGWPGLRHALSIRQKNPGPALAFFAWAGIRFTVLIVTDHPSIYLCSAMLLGCLRSALCLQ